MFESIVNCTNNLRTAFINSPTNQRDIFTLPPRITYLYAHPYYFKYSSKHPIGYYMRGCIEKL